jgi:mannonate dehydratase
MFDHIRSKIGFDVGLVHLIHERPAPNQAIQLCKAVEPYRPFFLEDPVAPEDVGWFQIFRQETSAPLAVYTQYCSVVLSTMDVRSNPIALSAGETGD